MAGQMNSKPLNVDTGAPSKSNTITQCSPVPAKKLVGISELQTCKNKGCGKTFKEKDNYETACSYHPGPAVFHDRMRGVGCYFFVVFLSIYLSSQLSNFEKCSCGLYTIAVEVL